MRGKLPFDAFEYYYSLGANRSYQIVADNFGVTKRAVTKRAIKERWQDQIAEMEAEIHENVAQQTKETIEQMMNRHLRQLKAIQGRAIEALRAMPLNTSMEAVRALGLAMKEERVMRGEPVDSATKSVEEIIKREYRDWLEPVPKEEVPEPEEQPSNRDVNLESEEQERK